MLTELTNEAPSSPVLVNPFLAPEFETFGVSIVEIFKVLGDVVGPQAFFDVFGDADT